MPLAVVVLSLLTFRQVWSFRFSLLDTNRHWRRLNSFYIKGQYSNAFMSKVAATDEDPDPSDIDQLLDTLHSAAANAKIDAYFDCFSSDGHFIGTDPSENWNMTEFRCYAEPAFQCGKGWSYACVKRNVTLYDGTIACFDEQLSSERFGHARGTGSLRLEGDSWKILQYHLSFPIPNDLATTVTDLVLAHYSKCT